MLHVIGNQKPQGRPFAINMALRKKNGDVIKMVYMEFDSASELYEAWAKNQVVRKKKSRADATTENATQE